MQAGKGQEDKAQKMFHQDFYGWEEKGNLFFLDLQCLFACTHENVIHSSELKDVMRSLCKHVRLAESEVGYKWVLISQPSPPLPSSSLPFPSLHFLLSLSAMCLFVVVISTSALHMKFDM